ncbi:unnamed protein product [Caenorhabditis nigoni]
MKNLFRNLAISGTLFFCAILLFSFDDATKWKSRFSFFNRCQHLLDERIPEIEILLIDVDFLLKLTEANGTTCLWNERNSIKIVFFKGPETADIMAKLRDELLDNGMFPFLNGGTFLGWYRECTIIPHTYDVDFAVFKYNYKPEYPYKLLNGESEFKLVRMFGKLEDGLELTVVQKHEANPRIDIFLMYDGIENGVLTHHYVPGLGDDGTKYQYTYPIYDPWCAAELHDHLFWVSCSPKSQITHEYGPQWYLDHPSSTYSWSSSGKNIKQNGKLSEEEMKKYYLTF